MIHVIRNHNLIILCGLCLLSSTCCLGQSGASNSPASQSGSSLAAGSPGQTTGPASPAPSSDKKKKVWTNDDVGDLNGPVSVVGNSKNSKTGKTSGDGSADGQYIANAKKQLEKLQAQLEDTKKQITALKDFQQGKAPEPTGYQLGKGYNRVPVDQQIASLDEKKKDLEQKISDLFDEARKKGVLPGQLR